MVFYFYVSFFSFEFDTVGHLFFIFLHLIRQFRAFLAKHFLKLFARHLNHPIQFEMEHLKILIISIQFGISFHPIKFHSATKSNGIFFLFGCKRLAFHATIVCWLFRLAVKSCRFGQSSYSVDYVYVRTTETHTTHHIKCPHYVRKYLCWTHDFTVDRKKKAKWNVAVACARLKHVRWIIAIPFRMHSQFSNCITFPQLNRSSAFFGFPMQS